MLAVDIEMRGGVCLGSAGWVCGIKLLQHSHSHSYAHRYAISNTPDSPSPSQAASPRHDPGTAPIVSHSCSPVPGNFHARIKNAGTFPVSGR